MSALLDVVVELAAAREEVAQRKAAIDAKRKAFELTIAEESSVYAFRVATVSVLDAQARALAVLAYDASKNKTPCPGLSIIGKKHYAIDEVAGLAWAREKEMCLIPESLDVKAVQKLATVQPLPFVTVTEVPEVRIASDLLAALDAAPQPEYTV